ncbi:corrinoid protein [Desulfosporosinus meridiei]|uniref:Putative cobalamin binding protein n=1 Tax=Desulfosporosinus meridiei (strain ATCC BAA-275 / DSM 13257 / KCTC 12902 / NCIMB 13706 / S10) TaxID=768704 RepID=J7ILQ9_DESMD|nr:corrinoid protein [Desulfosporosinus meridiei]AFQ42500.1 putative cobalamin binding protein [Desulfosporosinus meridiei DSM 13257]
MIFDDIIHSIAEGESEDTIELTKQALAQGYSASSILEKGLIKGMDIIAEKYRTEKVNVPEVLMATQSMHAGLSVIEPILSTPAKKELGKIILGTVAGDLHDIGLSIIKTMAMATGAKVIDLGVNVTPKKFASAVRKEKPNILMISALLTTTMSVMKDVIDELEAQGLRQGLKIIVGGAPITDAFAKEIGADYTFEDAIQFRNFLNDNLNKLLVSKGPARKSRSIHE